MSSSPLAAAMRDIEPHFIEQASQLDSDVWARLNIHLRIVFVITGRCGSTWLLHLLEDTGRMGPAHEFFSEDTIRYYAREGQARDIMEYLSAIVGRYSRDGVFGFQINPERFFWLGEIIDTEKMFVRSGSSWLDMRRRNIVGQAFSFARARASGTWHKYQGAMTDESTRIDVADEMVWSYIMKIANQEQLMDHYYKKRNISPLRLFYEDMLENKHFVVMSVLNHLGIYARGVSSRLLEIQDRTLPVRSEKDVEQELRFYERHLDAIEWLQRHRDRLHLPTFFREMVKPQLRF